MNFEPIRGQICVDADQDSPSRCPGCKDRACAQTARRVYYAAICDLWIGAAIFLLGVVCSPGIDECDPSEPCCVLEHRKIIEIDVAIDIRVGAVTTRADQAFRAGDARLEQ